MTEKEILEIVKKNPEVIWEIISSNPDQLIEILEKAKIKIATNKDLKILYYKKIDQKFNALIITIIIQTLAIIGTLIGIVLKVIQSMK